VDQLPGGGFRCAGRGNLPKSNFPSLFPAADCVPAPCLSESSFGVSYLSSDGIGCYSYVFYQRVAEQQRINEQNAAVLLGHVMAHEIAHLLLGTNSHSASGIMRAHWCAQELGSANKGELLFTPEQARVMTKRLQGNQQITEKISSIGTSETRNSAKSRK
jgi:hypothetical protein